MLAKLAFHFTTLDNDDMILIIKWFNLRFVNTAQEFNMTRINVVDPKTLCDQHLLAEHRELTRIPNEIVKKSGLVELSSEQKYLLGPGHVKFFRNKLSFLKSRYDELHNECVRRGFSVTYRWPNEAVKYKSLWNDYNVTECDLELNIARIIDRMPSSPRFTKYN